MARKKLYDLNELEVLFPDGERINAVNSFCNWTDLKNEIHELYDSEKKSTIDKSKIILPDGRLSKIIGSITSHCNDRFTEDQVKRDLKEAVDKYNVDFAIYNLESYQNKRPYRIKGILCKLILKSKKYARIKK